MKEVPELRALANNLMIDETPEGLRIQIVDQDKTPMFPLGSAEMLDPAKKLMSLITEVIKKLPNKISITGHTDSTQYAFSAKYTNWELSADRANASRREFLADGVPARPHRRASSAWPTREPLDKTDPSAPHNRRISIVLLRETPENLTAAPSAAPSPSQAAAAAPASPAVATSASASAPVLVPVSPFATAPISAPASPSASLPSHAAIAAGAAPLKP